MAFGEVDKGSAARVGHNEPGAGQNGVLDKGGGHRVRLRHVGADHKNHLGLGKIREGIRHGAGTE